MANIHITDTREFERFDGEIRSAITELDQVIRSFRSHNSRVQRVWLDAHGKKFTSDVQAVIRTLERQKSVLESDLQRRLQRKIQAIRSFGT